MFNVLKDLMINIGLAQDIYINIGNFELSIYLYDIIPLIITISTTIFLAILFIKILLIPHKLIHKAYHKWENKNMIKRGEKK